MSLPRNHKYALIRVDKKTTWPELQKLRGVKKSRNKGGRSKRAKREDIKESYDDVIRRLLTVYKNAVLEVQTMKTDELATRYSNNSSGITRSEVEERIERIKTEAQQNKS